MLLLFKRIAVSHVETLAGETLETARARRRSDETRESIARENRRGDATRRVIFTRYRVVTYLPLVCKTRGSRSL